MKRIFCLILVFVSFFAFVSCSSKKKKEETLKIEEEISQEISAEEGGKIENSDKSISIEVPGEALESNTKITMKIYDAGKYIGTEGKDFISKVVEFEPSGIIFKKPVIITMTSLKNVENKIISAAVYRDEKGEWSYSKRGAYVILTGRDEGGDPIMKSAGGDPIMLNAGGDPIMIPEDGGDPIMLSAGGDPIMVKAGGDPIMQDEGGDPIMHDDGGDPIMNAAGGDPIMNAAGGDPIMMTTGHFTAYGFIALDPKEGEAVENPEKDDETTDKDDDNTEITENDDVINDEDEISDNDDDNIEITEDDDAINDEDETPDEIEDLDPINPCDGNPCQEIANSTHECLIQDDGYACGCNTGYAWNGAQCVVPLGRICTGQNKCYDNEGEIECPAAGEDFYGQDAQYAALGTCMPQSFTVQTISGDNIVVDNNTGLIWQQSPSEETFTWDNAITYCENLTYAGNSDWRLPNPLEFLTIVDNSSSNPATNLNFTNIPTYSSVGFWTSKEYKGNTSYAYTFDYYYGYYEGRAPDLYLKNKTYQILCVSGNEMQPATSSNFTTETISGEAVVTDSVTGLMWQKDYASDKTWQQALKYCEDLTYAGYSDWRLPNKNEFASLVNYEKSEEPYSDFPDMTTRYYFWSSSTYVGLTDVAWGTSFSEGNVRNRYIKIYNFPVKCVRSDLPSNSERTSACTGLPENAEWNSASTFTQTWNGSAWLPSATAVYSEEASTENCRFKCAEGFEWNDYECVRTTPLSLGNICTGQNKCYDNEGEIECPAAGEDFYGQDAQYAALGICVPQSFAVHTVAGDNIVIDRNTKLIWQQSPSEETFTWDDAITYCENLTYAGNSDWRLPNPLEFLTIVDNSKSDPATNSKFTNMPSDDSSYLWTNKEYKEDTTLARAFNPYKGYVSYGESKTSTYNLMCVRGNELPSANFTTSEIGGDTVVTDSTTGLQWQKDYAANKKWQEALLYCEELNYAGYTDWRLPNKNELASLLNYDKTETPYSDFPDMPSDGNFWASSSLGDKKWHLVASGNIDRTSAKQTWGNYTVKKVRCVRSNLPIYSERTAVCTGLLENAEWNSVSKITQTWSGSEWLPSATAVYSEEPSTENCRFKCADDFAWNGYACIRITLLPLSRICTGQDKCYNASAEIECPTAGEDFYGQDAQYAALGTCTPQSFTVQTISGNNVVFDNNTGLEWQQSPTEETFTWDDAITYCENLTYAGNSDWRLPNPLEFLTIVDNSKSDPATNSKFTNMPSDDSSYLWTNKEYKEDTTLARAFNPYKGYVSYGESKTSTYSLMCVRGNELPSANFTTSEIGGDTVITDSTTGLIWQNIEVEKKWQEALLYCEELNYAGYTDWRLPNKNELASLLNYDKTEAPYSDFPDISSDTFYSSSSLSESKRVLSTNTGGVGAINIGWGGDYRTAKVHCVRSE